MRPRFMNTSEKGETMTITLERRNVTDSDVMGSDTGATMTWVEADAGLWVGNVSGTFGGSIDRIDGAYRATDTFGGTRGDFERLADAQQCLESFMAHPAVIGRLRSRAA
jgi:hypothetical protein